MTSTTPQAMECGELMLGSDQVSSQKKKTFRNKMNPWVCRLVANFAHVRPRWLYAVVVLALLLLPFSAGFGIGFSVAKSPENQDTLTSESTPTSSDVQPTGQTFTSTAPFDSMPETTDSSGRTTPTESSLPLENASNTTAVTSKVKNSTSPLLNNLTETREEERTAEAKEWLTKPEPTRNDRKVIKPTPGLD